MLEVKKSFYDYSSLLFGNTTTIILQLISFTLIARLLTVEDYGIYNLFLTVVNFFVLFGVSWTSGALVIFGKEEFLKTRSIKTTFWSRLLLISSILVAILIVLFFFRNFVTSYVGLKNSLFYIFFIYILSYSIIEHDQYTFQATNKIKLFSMVPVINKIFFIIMILSAIFFNKSTVLYIITALVISNLITLLFSILFLDPESVMPVSISKNKISEMLLFSYPIIFGALSSYVVMWVDIIVIKAFLTTEAVGIYSLAYRITEYMAVFTQSFSTLMLPIITAFIVKDKLGHVKNFCERLIPQFLFLWSLILFPVLLCGPYAIVYLFGSKYNPSILPFYLLVGGSISRTIISTTSPIITANKLIKASVLISVFESLVNLILDLALVQILGINGPAIATVITFFTGSLLYIYILRKRVNIGKYSLLLYNIPLVLGILVMILTQSFVLRIVLLLGIMITFCLIIKLSNTFTEEDTKMVEYIEMPRIVKKILLNIMNIFI